MGTDDYQKCRYKNCGNSKHYNYKCHRNYDSNYGTDNDSDNDSNYGTDYDSNYNTDYNGGYNGNDTGYNGNNNNNNNNIGPQTFKSKLKGRNEVPPNNSQATGVLTGLLSENDQRFNFALETNNLNNIISAHFHDGPAGVNGPIVKTININLSTGSAVGSWTSTDSEPLTPALVQKLKTGLIYVNVHTTAFPGGEIRDQVFPAKCKQSKPKKHSKKYNPCCYKKYKPRCYQICKPCCKSYKSTLYY